MASIAVRIKESLDLAEERIGELNFAQKVFVILDSAWERYVHGTYKGDYFLYGFYFKRGPERRKFITLRLRTRIINTCNDPEKSKIFSDKGQFAKVFRDYIGRDVLDMNHATMEEFLAYTARHDRMFIKPVDGTYGRGTEILTCGEGVDNVALYEQLRGKNVLAEEVIVQHPSLAAFNETSLNSMRVVTLLDANNVPHVMRGAIIRLGRKGKIADNFHHGGVGAQIDVETGIVTTTTINREGVREVVHPDSKLPVVGFQIPCWELVCERVKQAAMVCPEVRYVGWDVAVTADGGVVLVEGNDMADPDLGQMSDGVGKWPDFEPYILELEKLKKK